MQRGGCSRNVIPVRAGPVLNAVIWMTSNDEYEFFVPYVTLTLFSHYLPPLLTAVLMPSCYLPPLLMVELIPRQHRALTQSSRQCFKEPPPLRRNWRISISAFQTKMYSTSHSAVPWKSRIPSWNGNFKSSRPPPSAHHEVRGWRQQKSNRQVSFDYYHYRRYRRRVCFPLYTGASHPAGYTPSPPKYTQHPGGILPIHPQSFRIIWGTRKSCSEDDIHTSLT